MLNSWQMSSSTPLEVVFTYSFSLLTWFPQDENKQLPSSVPKKQTKPKLSAGKDRSVDSAVDKQRQEARKRLMAAKRAASVRQNSATESADSIEIYVPEAQTRLWERTSSDHRGTNILTHIQTYTDTKHTETNTQMYNGCTEADPSMQHSWWHEGITGLNNADHHPAAMGQK